MRKDVFIIFHVIFLASLLMLSACQSTSSAPSAVFSDQCATPCWRHITPGETKFQDAVDLIKNFRDVDSKNVAVWQPGRPGDIVSDIVGFSLMNGDDIRVYAIENTVALITFYSPIGITFEDCVKKFGQPEYATQFSKLGPGELLFAPSEATHIWFSVVSPKRGVSFGYDTQNSFDLNADTKISDISYFDVKLYNTLYQNNLILAFDPQEEVPQSKLYTWKGYGDIKKFYP